MYYFNKSDMESTPPGSPPLGRLRRLPKPQPKSTPVLEISSRCRRRSRLRWRRPARQRRRAEGGPGGQGRSSQSPVARNRAAPGGGALGAVGRRRHGRAWLGRGAATPRTPAATPWIWARGGASGPDWSRSGLSGPARPGCRPSFAAARQGTLGAGGGGATSREQSFRGGGGQRGEEWRHRLVVVASSGC